MKSRNPASLTAAPGVGRAVARILRNAGIQTIPDLKGKNPTALYNLSNKIAGRVQDKCLLYTFRCAIYFAETKNPKPALLQWWNWKDTDKWPRKYR